jgi:hypothetical protein
LANSSRDKPFVSGMSIENRPPINIHAEKIKSNGPTNALLPPISFNFEKPTWATIAPSFPEAAEIP